MMVAGAMWVHPAGVLFAYRDLDEATEPETSSSDFAPFRKVVHLSGRLEPDFFQLYTGAAQPQTGFLLKKSCALASWGTQLI
jgi:hypothetical protein